MLSTQPARSCKWPTGRRSVSSRGFRRIVSRLAGNTNSIFCEGHRRWPETANGCLVLRKAGALAEKAQIAAENSAVIVFARSSVARVGRTSFSLDKDLSWMSATRKQAGAKEQNRQLPTPTRNMAARDNSSEGYPNGLHRYCLRRPAKRPRCQIR